MISKSNEEEACSVIHTWHLCSHMHWPVGVNSKGKSFTDLRDMTIMNQNPHIMPIKPLSRQGHGFSGVIMGDSKSAWKRLFHIYRRSSDCATTEKSDGRLHKPQRRCRWTRHYRGVSSQRPGF